jgi:selenocysteine lyase/cysteine desulfurase
MAATITQGPSPPNPEPRGTEEPPLSPDHFDLDSEVLWLMHCAEGPVPEAAARAVREFLERETRPWTLRWKEDFQGLPEATRVAGAAVLGARAEDVTLTATTSSGLVTVAQGFPWRPGDETVVPLGEFPSNYWCWRALGGRGVSVREVPLWNGHRTGARAWESTPPPPHADPEGRLLDALGPATRILSVSWVRFQDGLRLDLERLARDSAERGVALVVDGIQGAGTLPVPLGGVAAFATGGHKGLLTPQGIGLLWTDPDFRRRLLPSGTWLSVADATDFSRPSTDFDRDWLPTGERLEPGVPNLLACAAFRESLELLHRAGVERIAGHVAALRGRLLDGLSSLPRWRREAERLRELDRRGRLGPIVALHHGGAGADALDRLLRHGMSRGVYGSVREGYFRIALHGWHRAADVDRVLEWLEASP